MSRGVSYIRFSSRRSVAAPSLAGFILVAARGQSLFLYCHISDIGFWPGCCYLGEKAIQYCLHWIAHTIGTLAYIELYAYTHTSCNVAYTFVVIRKFCIIRLVLYTIFIINTCEYI